jgi:hypothetical protein
LSGRLLSELTPLLLPLPLLLLPVLLPRVTAPLPVREPLLERLVVVVVVGRFTWLLLLGVADMLRLLLEVLRFTCGVAELRLMLELELELRLTVGAVDWLLERETAADWLLLLVLPPCERLRPWAIASDALKIRHPMRAKLIMIFVTEVFIIVLY